MPGSFNFPTPKVSGAKIYQTPQTPTGSVYMSSATGSAMSTTNYHNISKKRSRIDDDYRSRTPTRDEELMDPASPFPLVNTRYTLKGGLDTPTLAAEQRMNESQYSDIHYRRELSGTESGLLGEENGGYQSFLPLDLDRETNGRSRRTSGRSFTNNNEGWSKAALGVVGGVVGKVWEFCKTSAFRGFHAGGGKGYTVNGNRGESHFSYEINEKTWETEQITTTWGDDRESTPLPGQFPEEDFIPNWMSNPTPDATPPRAGKRRQIATNTDELARNWVVVPPPNARPSTPSNPQIRGPARYSMQTASSTSRRSVVGRPTSRASTVAPRRPALQRVSHAGSPALQSSNGASFASPRSPGGSKIPRFTNSPMSGIKNPPENKVESPAAKEAKKWAAVKRKEEREADVTLRRLDSQLKAMIREGKEALGTKVEVEMDGDMDFDFKPSPSKSRRWAV